MRISSSMIFEGGGTRISDLQASLNKTQQQIAAGRQILTPADDPIGSARALVISQADAINEQYAVNRNNAKHNLSMSDGVLSSVSSTMHNIKTLLVSAGNGVLNDTDRGYIATELQGNLDQLLGLANSTDGAGGYLFSGFSTTVAPYTKTTGGAAYNGDQGQRYLQVDTARQIPLSAPGTGIFENIRTSAGQFNVVPAPANVGQGTATASINPATAASLTGNNYEVLFDATGANFTVTNKTTGTVALASTPYANPTTVTVDGINITLGNGATVPAAGDRFAIQPGNQNIFETLTDVINALKTPTSSVAAKKDFTTALAQANGNLDLSLSNVLTARSQIGVSLKEIEDLDNVGDTNSLNYKQTLSQLQDLDYVKAITSLTQQQSTLQAAQQSFVRVANLSLFNYIN